MSVFRLTQHTYQILAQSGSVREDGDAATLPRHMGPNNRVVTEFDYRQNLHMECGVVALDPPPTYAIAMKELPQNHAKRERGASMHSGNIPMASPVSRGSPPPYKERERAGADRGGREEPNRDSEVIRLASICLTDNNELGQHHPNGDRI